MKKVTLCLFVLSMVVFTSCGKLKKDIIVKSGKVAVYFNEEDKELKVLTPGVHSVPLKTQFTTYPITKLTFQENQAVLTKDQKEVLLTITMRYTLNKELIAKLHREIGRDFEEKIINFLMGAAIRDVMSNVNADDIQLDVVSRKVKEFLDEASGDAAYIEVHSLRYEYI